MSLTDSPMCQVEMVRLSSAFIMILFLLRELCNDFTWLLSYHIFFELENFALRVQKKEATERPPLGEFIAIV